MEKRLETETNYHKQETKSSDRIKTQILKDYMRKGNNLDKSKTNTPEDMS
jgi:hypothetical protein